MDTTRDKPGTERYSLILSDNDISLLTRMSDDALGLADASDALERLHRMAEQGLVRTGLYGRPGCYITARGRMIAQSFRSPTDAPFFTRRGA